MTTHPRGAIDARYAARCGFCQRTTHEATSRKEARDTALFRGWRKSTAYGWLCVRCSQARQNNWPRVAGKEAHT